MKLGMSVLSFAALAAVLGGCAEVTRTAPSASTRTAVVVPPGSTVVVAAPPAPWCGGTYGPRQGTNFGTCPAGAAVDTGAR